jgi:hypothetical protein
MEGTAPAASDFVLAGRRRVESRPPLAEAEPAER